MHANLYIHLYMYSSDMTAKQSSTVHVVVIIVVVIVIIIVVVVVVVIVVVVVDDVDDLDSHGEEGLGKGEEVKNRKRAAAAPVAAAVSFGQHPLLHAVKHARQAFQGFDGSKPQPAVLRDDLRAGGEGSRQEGRPVVQLELVQAVAGEARYHLLTRQTPTLLSKLKATIF